MSEKMMGWDSQITEAPILPATDAAGNKIDYDFEIIQFKRNAAREFSKGPNAYTALSIDLKMNLKAEVDGEVHEGTAEDMLILTVKSQFKIFQYFTAIGLRAKGSGNFDPVKTKAWVPDTNLAKVGKCHIKIDEFNGQKRVKIDKYLEPEQSGVDL